MPFEMTGDGQSFGLTTPDQEMPKFFIGRLIMKFIAHAISLVGYSNWLVVWNIFFIFPYIGLLIIPIDELIFFRGVAQPPTSH